jgi:hypothetical protein
VGTLAVTVVMGSLCGSWTVAGASAAPPAWHYCGKATPKNTGSYSDRSCSLASEPGAGAYELLPGVGKGKPFLGKGGAGQQVLIVIPHRGELHMACDKSVLRGHPVAPSGVQRVVITYSKCAVFGSPCRSEGEPKGTVRTEALSGELGWLDREKGLAGLSLTNEASPGSGYIVRFSCEFGRGRFEAFRSFGAFIGEIPTTGALRSEFPLEYRTQYLEELEGPTSPPEFEERFVGTLQTEKNGAETGFEWAVPGGYRSALEHGLEVTGEGLAIF